MFQILQVELLRGEKRVCLQYNIHMEQFKFVEPDSEPKIEQKDSQEKYFALSNVKMCEQKLEKLLKNLEQGADFSQSAQRELYHMLTRRSTFVAQTDEIGKTPGDLMKAYGPQMEWYQKTRDALEKEIDTQKEFTCESNPGWFGINTRPETPARDEINIKMYATIPVNEYSFIKYILVLAKQLKQIGAETDDVIKIKIPQSLTAFVSHNDSIVIHFKNKDNIEKIQEAINLWMRSNGVHEEEREMGRTKIAADSKETSFSDLVSKNVADWLVDHFGSYDTKVLIHEGIKHTISQSQKNPLEHM